MTKCLICGKEFEPRVKDQIYCGRKCNQMAYRSRGDRKYVLYCHHCGRGKRGDNKTAKCECGKRMIKHITICPSCDKPAALHFQSTVCNRCATGYSIQRAAETISNKPRPPQWVRSHKYKNILTQEFFCNPEMLDMVKNLPEDEVPSFRNNFLNNKYKDKKPVDLTEIRSSYE